MVEFDEIDLDLQDAPWLNWLALTILAALVLLGLSFIGRRATPLENQQPRVLRWQDWQIQQARQRHRQEIALLRADLSDISEMARAAPDPVAAQILRARISSRAESGEATLALARAQLQSAADGLAAWAGGLISREELIALIQRAEESLR